MGAALTQLSNETCMALRVFFTVEQAVEFFPERPIPIYKHRLNDSFQT
jgi:hypothetical protein